MMSVHCIVVWEWQCEGHWLPHTPTVSRTLERAYAKKLTRVVLADAEPALRGHYVNLRTLTQTSDSPEGGWGECGVRRACYSVHSPGGRGARWEWARLAAPPHPADLVYEPLPMEVQCRLEAAWSLGVEAVLVEPWVVSTGGMTARGPGGRVRLVRRAPQPPYPLTRSSAPPPPPPPPPLPLPPAQGRRGRIPQQHTGCSVHSAQAGQGGQAGRGGQGGQAGQSAGARSASPRERKPGLARQILHNLNIFSNSNKPPAGPCESGREREEVAEGGGGGGGGGRRHSVDTVSTYLSHESKDSLQQAAVGELLECSAGSDDVFESHSPAACEAEDVCVPAAVRWCVRGVAQPQWGALCPACMRPLGAAGGAGGTGGPAGGTGGPVVALLGCHHMMHLHCLNNQLHALADKQEPAYIECLVCGRVYEPQAAGAGAGGPGPDPGGSGPDPGGPQPSGSMAWCVQPGALPGHPPASGCILVTYNFQSGVQGPPHPCPGAPYYAVGFPRHSLLPDTPLGRQVLMLLRAAWERRVLFCVSTSRTTGREHVVAWAVPPPPAARAHYAPPGGPAGGPGGPPGGPAGGAHDALADALRHLRALLAAR